MLKIKNKVFIGIKVFIILILFGNYSLMSDIISNTDADNKNYVVNGSFELGNGKGFNDWQIIGDKFAVKRSWGGNSSNYKLDFWSNKPYKVEVSQTIKNLADNEYIFSVFIKAGIFSNNNYITLKKLRF